ncbi:MAG: RING finger domain-containing protein [Candidatus Paceibacterota bacterium]
MGLILLDLLFWIIPEIEIFGETVRDLLVCEELSILNLQTRNITPKIFIKKLRKFRNNIEINGYILKEDTSEEYHKSWYIFEENFLRNGMAAGVIQKISPKGEEIRILLVSSEKLNKYHPIFMCNMLKMTSDSQINLLDPQKLLGTGYLDQYRLASGRIAILQEILDDIHNKRVSPIIRPIRIGTGYEDRLRRSEMIFMLVELMEEGWIPTFKIEECGFNLKIHRVETSLSRKFKYPPQLRQIYKKLSSINKVKENFEENKENENFETENFETKNKENENKENENKENENKEKEREKEKEKENEENVKENKENEKIDESSEICAICHESLLIGSILKINCGHMYHNDCIFQHFHKVGSNSDTCPICRFKVIQNISIKGYNSIFIEEDESDDMSDDSTDTESIDINDDNIRRPPPPPPLRNHPAQVDLVEYYSV